MALFNRASKARNALQNGYASFIFNVSPFSCINGLTVVKAWPKLYNVLDQVNLIFHEAGVNEKGRQRFTANLPQHGGYTVRSLAC
jgi:hypothetical protein